MKIAGIILRPSMKQTSVGRHVMLLCFLSHGSFVSDGGFHYAHIGVTNACTQFVLSKGKIKELSNTGPRGSGGVVEALESRHICS